ncbi:hypothetical protein EYF80_016617 [Liparis tanakae]|uniref:Uncharacterized protein n=1 Tax=Liparis tanakae TaxID=230148 RepID=A0A4Z2I5T5_9TELE|nr:hypothetical protein EYF80_016617 [Liparis tanakae]
MLLQREEKLLHHSREEEEEEEKEEEEDSLRNKDLTLSSTRWMSLISYLGKKPTDQKERASSSPAWYRSLRDTRLNRNAFRLQKVTAGNVMIGVVTSSSLKWIRSTHTNSRKVSEPKKNTTQRQRLMQKRSYVKM